MRVLDVIDRQGEGAAFVVAQRGDDVVEVVTGVVVLADLTAFLAEFQRDPVLAFYLVVKSQIAAATGVGAVEVEGVEVSVVVADVAEVAVGDVVPGSLEGFRRLVPELLAIVAQPLVGEEPVFVHQVVGDRRVCRHEVAFRPVVDRDERSAVRHVRVVYKSVDPLVSQFERLVESHSHQIEYEWVGCSDLFAVNLAEDFQSPAVDAAVVFVVSCLVPYAGVFGDRALLFLQGDDVVVPGHRDGHRGHCHRGACLPALEGNLLVLKIQHVELEVALESEAGSLSAGGLRISEVVHHLVVGVQCQHAARALVDGIGACRGFPLAGNLAADLHLVALAEGEEHVESPVVLPGGRVVLKQPAVRRAGQGLVQPFGQGLDTVGGRLVEDRINLRDA